jgi:CBS domain-containing protein
MGEKKLQDSQDEAALQLFSRQVLQDLRAFERLLAEERIESDVGRIGAEQELFIVDGDWRPAPRNLELLAAIDDPHYTTELGSFNLEFNLDPIRLAGDCLRVMEGQIEELLAKGRRAASQMDVELLLIGILPTLRASDLALANMTPTPRYAALNAAMDRARGDRYRLRIKGQDELIFEHDSVMLEACNTSFQLHFQVAQNDFARRYNIAQAVAAPVLACATNSPLLFGRRLWRETRIALFQQSVDTRSAGGGEVRQSQPRVSFGRQWVRESALEIFQEDLARFPVLLATEIDEDPFEAIAAGRAPKLQALRLHNGTVYRWNRPCYGISAGKPHLRIENRVLPSGPTPLDEMANAALWFGLMEGLAGEYEDITRVMRFEAARENFVHAARGGLGASLSWPGQERVLASDLLLDELLPLARSGLDGLGIDRSDADRYLGVIEERIRSRQTGSKWLLTSLSTMHETEGGALGEQLVALTAAAHSRQNEGRPVHTWPLATLEDAGSPQKFYQRVEQIMTTDLFTVSEDQLVDIAAHVMDWRHVRHVPVEDKSHRLVGLVTHRALIRLLVDQLSNRDQSPTPVREIMQRHVITVRPETTTREALSLMRKHRISVLPVIDHESRLVGILSERDFMGVAGKLLDEFLDR